MKKITSSLLIFNSAKSMMLCLILFHYYVNDFVDGFPASLNPKRLNKIPTSDIKDKYAKGEISTFSHSHLTPEDLECIQNQLGYIPPNLVRISARRANGNPLALQTYPLNGGAAARKKSTSTSWIPFPTLFWFCCPDVSRAIADLERTGYVQTLQKKLESNPEYLERWYENHDAYAEQRWMSLKKEHRSFLISTSSSHIDESNENDSTEIMSDFTRERIKNMLKNSGVAGTDYRARGDQSVPSIKCLHAHYAHYRSSLEHSDLPSELNIVGEWTHELLQLRYTDLIL